MSGRARKRCAETQKHTLTRNLLTVIKRTMFRSAQCTVSLFHFFSRCLLSLLSSLVQSRWAQDPSSWALPLPTPVGHTHSNLHSYLYTLYTHTQHFMHCLRLIFLSHLFESRPLRVHTNADLETQKIRHLNSDWREMYPPSEETLWRSDSILF